MTRPDMMLLSQAFNIVREATGSSWIAARELNSHLRDGTLNGVLRVVDQIDEDKWVPVNQDAWNTIRVLQPRTAKGHARISGHFPKYRQYFVYLARSQVEEIWLHGNKTVETATPNQVSRRKGYGGRGGDYDWEKCLIEAARWMHFEGVPKKQAELVRHLQAWFGDDCPSDSQLKEHLGPLFLAFKTDEPPD